MRKGGLAVIEPSADAVAARTQGGAASSEWPESASPDDLREASPRGAIAPDAFIAAPAAIPVAAVAAPSPVLGAPDRLSARARATAAANSATDWPPAASAPERSRRSVVIACVVGATIAAAIVALAFTFRPATGDVAAPSVDAPASTPAE